MQKKSQHQAEIVRRYVSALEGAIHKANMPQLIQNFIDFSKILCSDNKFSVICALPLSQSNRLSLIDVLCQKADLGSIITNFLKILVLNNRFYLTEKIANLLEQHIEANNNKIRVDLTVAREMTDLERSSAEKSISTLIKATPIINTKIDPNILSGYIVIFNGKKIDASLHYKLKKLHDTMKGDA